MNIKSITNNHMGMGQGCTRSKGHTILGVGLATLGFFWLAKKLGWIPIVAGGPAVFWPAVSIAVGITIILSARRNHKNPDIGDPPNNNN